MRTGIVLLPALGMALGACGGNKGGDSAAPLPDFYIKATIDGKPFEVSSTTALEAMRLEGYDSAWVDQNVHAQSVTFGEKRDRIRIEAMSLFDGPPDQEDVFQVFYEGRHDYGTMTRNADDDDEEVPGVNVVFWDNDGADWWCSTSRGEQAGSTFNVTLHDLYEGSATQDGLRIWGITEGVFSCTLYSKGGSGLELVDGSLRMLTILMD